MDLQRLQVILNHEDPTLVTEGLDQFTDTILRDHNADKAFGYYGRPFDLTTLESTAFPAAVTGVLAEYLAASPQAEELFVLWDVETRSELKQLAASHTRCMAAIIHCSHNQKHSETICRRIVRHYMHRLTAQLSQNTKPEEDVVLTHATLGLLLTMAQTTDDIATETFQSLQLSTSVLHSVSASPQQGKISWRPKKSRRPVTMNTRSMVVAFLCSLLAKRDYATTSQLLAPRSLFWALTDQLEYEVHDALKCFLRTVLSHVLHWEGLSHQTRGGCLDSLMKPCLACYGSTRANTQTVTHEFFMSIVESNQPELLIGGSSEREQHSSRLLSMIQVLQPHQNLKHREFVSKCLKLRPAMLGLCISLGTQNWEPRLGLSYLNNVTYLVSLLTHTPVAQQPATIDIDDDMAGVQAREQISSWVPRGLGKKELTKLLLHSDLLLQRLGLSLISAILFRCKQAVPQSQQLLIANVLAPILPDFQSLLTLRAKLLAELTTSPSAINQDDIVEQPQAAEEESEVAQEAPGSSSLYMYTLVMQTCLMYEQVVPSMILSSFDETKFVDDLPALLDRVGGVDSTLAEAAVHINLSCVASLRSRSTRFHWLGQFDDTRKMLVNLLVQADWRTSVKRSQFGTLLDCYRSCPSAVKPMVKSLLLGTIESSQLFHAPQSSPQAVLHSSAEIELWLQLAEQGENWCLLVDVLFRVAYHFNRWVCEQVVRNTAHSAVPFSAVLAAALALFDLSFPEAELPRNVTSNLEQTPARFLQKFVKGIWTWVCWALHFLAPVVDRLSVDSLDGMRRFLAVNAQKGTLREILDASDDTTLSAVASSLNGFFGRDATTEAGQIWSQKQLLEEVPDASSRELGAACFGHLLLDDIGSCLLEPGSGCMLASLLLTALTKGNGNAEMGRAALIVERLRQLGLALCKQATVADVGRLTLIGLQLVDLWNRCMLQLLDASGSQALAQCASLICTTSADLLSDMTKRLHHLNADQVARALAVKSLDSEFARSCFLRREAPGLLATYFVTVLAFSSAPLLETQQCDEGSPLVEVLQPYLEQADQAISGAQRAWAQHVCLTLSDVWFKCGMANTFWNAICRSADDSMLQLFVQSTSATTRSQIADSLQAAILEDEDILDSLYQHAADGSVAASTLLRVAVSEVTQTDASAHLCHVLLQRKLLNGPLLWDLAEVLVSTSQLSCLELAAVVAETTGDEPAAIRVKELCGIPTNAEHKVYAQIVAQRLRHAATTPDKTAAGQPHKYAIGFDVSHVAQRSENVRAILYALDKHEAYTYDASQYASVTLQQMLQCVRQSSAASHVIDCLVTAVSVCFKIVKHAIHEDTARVDSYCSVAEQLVWVCSRTPCATATDPQKGKLAKAVVKLVKLGLKHSFEIASVCKFLHGFCGMVYWEGTFYSLLAAQPGMLSAVHLHALLATHSEFGTRVSVKTSRLTEETSSCKSAALELLLLFVHLIEAKHTAIDRELHWTALRAIIQGYSATMHSADRIACRIFEAYRRLDINVSLDAIHMCLSDEPMETGLALREQSYEWYFVLFDLPTVHATITSFPTNRCLLPAPLPWEPSETQEQYGVQTQAILKSLRSDSSQVTEAGLDDLTSGDEESDAEGSSSGESDEDEPVMGRKKRHDLAAVHQCTREAGYDCLSSCYDPSFYLPVLQRVLANSVTPGRRFAQSGVLSLVLVSLSSSCPMTRACAYASLQQIYELLNEQASLDDTSFKERPQLVLLTRFVRDSGSAQILDAPIPVTSAIFLARAALILLTPSHELYGAYNKYLLAKPFLDRMDVPLYSSLLFSDDSERHWKDTATCIRLVRDGLRTSADHLNLCRKHVYSSVLMLLNWCNDGATMQSGIDLLQRGLQQQDSARYILDRCAIIRWLGGQCLPPQAVVDVQNQLLPIGNRLAPRMIALLRMALHASVLLSWQLDQVLADVSDCAISLVDAVLTNHFAVTTDYWYQLVCLLSDIRVLQAQTEREGVGARGWLSMEQICKMAATLKPSSTTRDRDLHLSLMLLSLTPDVQGFRRTMPAAALPLLKQWTQCVREHLSISDRADGGVSKEPYVHALHNLYGDVTIQHTDGHTQIASPSARKSSGACQLAESELPHVHSDVLGWQILRHMAWNSSSVCAPIEHCGGLGMALILAKNVQQFVASVDTELPCVVEVAEVADLLRDMAQLALVLCRRRTKSCVQFDDAANSLAARTLVAMKVIPDVNKAGADELPQRATAECGLALVELAFAYEKLARMARGEQLFTPALTQLLEAVSCRIHSGWDEAVGSRKTHQEMTAAIEAIAIASLQPGRQAVLQQSCAALTTSLSEVVVTRSAHQEFGGGSWLFDKSAFEPKSARRSTTPAATKKQKRKSDAAANTGKKSKRV